MIYLLSATVFILAAVAGTKNMRIRSRVIPNKRYSETHTDYDLGGVLSLFIPKRIRPKCWNFYYVFVGIAGFMITVVPHIFTLVLGYLGKKVRPDCIPVYSIPLLLAAAYTYVVSAILAEKCQKYWS